MSYTIPVGQNRNLKKYFFDTRGYVPPARNCSRLSRELIVTERTRAHTTLITHHPSFARGLSGVHLTVSFARAPSVDFRTVVVGLPKVHSSALSRRSVGLYKRRSRAPFPSGNGRPCRSDGSARPEFVVSGPTACGDSK